jgi:hypothetical protein
MADKTLKILCVAQRAVDTGRGNLQPLVFDTIHFQRKLQLAINLFAVFDIDKLLLGLQHLAASQ